MKSIKTLLVLVLLCIATPLYAGDLQSDLIEKASESDLVFLGTVLKVMPYGNGEYSKCVVTFHVSLNFKGGTGYEDRKVYFSSTYCGMKPNEEYLVLAKKFEVPEVLQTLEIPERYIFVSIEFHELKILGYNIAREIGMEVKKEAEKAEQVK